MRLKSVSGLGAACAIGVYVVAFILSSSQTHALPLTQTPTPAGDPAGAQLFTRMCSECHDSKRVINQRRTSAEWEDVLKKMIEEGAEGTEKDFQAVFEYLVHTVGKVFVNTAKSADIRAVLGLTAEQADAIVAYRTANGPFADAAAVKKVPGIDPKKIDELADAIAF